eukprot:3229284-Pleurochrysis_carterae.AAC.1
MTWLIILRTPHLTPMYASLPTASSPKGVSTTSSSAFIYALCTKCATFYKGRSIPRARRIAFSSLGTFTKSDQ